MVFRSKIDKFFVITIAITLLIILAVCIIPLVLSKSTVAETIVVLSLCALSIGLILWSAFFIRYEFFPNHLFVRGGLFRSRIPYEKITKVTPTSAIFTGYRIMSSRDGIEIFYQNATLGSVKVSPKNKSEFIAELKKHCPNVQIQD
ncbi:PH domain-containing protein [Virgibacillus sp. 179-BFC.A HS]|uniref:PH domain-containing protein n=1 Tax=Tigheibacillus jepli TaxID=3035914 RepID=A0ABU5CL18_9BACI|nr:PH domain-containing protein [Virgibacillus sp. 179-BFC.A HS]MDY0407053.1 PH domain-containing protein [Virgibacillus sp. 179-BFC.A HS]